MLTHERRRLPRLPVRLPVTLLVLIPESPIYPALHEGVVLDLSEQGAMVSLNLPEAAYRAISSRPHYFPTGFRNHPQLPNVVGKAAWIRPVASNGHTNYQMGLFFEECPKPIVDKLRLFLDQHAESLSTEPG